MLTGLPAVQTETMYSGKPSGSVPNCCANPKLIAGAASISDVTSVMTWMDPDTTQRPPRWMNLGLLMIQLLNWQ
jgi:hypothetical protein